MNAFEPVVCPFLNVAQISAAIVWLLTAIEQNNSRSHWSRMSAYFGLAARNTG